MKDTGKVETTVLVIEDDPKIQRFLRSTLSHQGYRVLEATTGEAGLTLAASRRPDLIILDLGLPDIDGLTIATRIRQSSRTPILILSARGQERDKVSALDAGADDYLTKPFGVDELTARMRVALRHAAHLDSDQELVTFEVGDLHIDFSRRMVRVREEEVHLTPTEYKLLTTLARYAGKVVTHHQLLREVWGPSFEAQTHYLRLFVKQLRDKIEASPAHPRYLRTEAGVGYRLMDE